jgi:ABC-2 type transport system permease protein
MTSATSSATSSARSATRGAVIGAGLGTMARTHVHAGWKVMLGWVGALAATMFATTTSIAGLYDTPAKIRSYADAVGEGDALVVINGDIAGLDTLGGVIANEFGFVASFAIPFMAIALVARMTRKDEEQGRLELLLAGRIGRSAPLVAALLVVGGALALTALSLFLALVVVDVPTADSALYAASMLGLGLVFAAIAALTAQLVEHARGVTGVGLAAIVAAYLLRGIGDVAEGGLAWLTWLSPLGWQEETRAFGDSRWWPLLVAFGVAAVLAAAAVVVSSRRDLGGALLRRGAAAPSASGFLRTQLGMAVRLHQGSVLGWAIGALVVMAVFGGLADPLIDAIAGNEALAQAMGIQPGPGGTGIDVVIAMSVLILALLAAGYAVQASGILRAEETSGRLEPTLAGGISRWSWLGTQVLVIALGVLGVAVLGGGALAVTAAWSTGDDVGGVAEATADFLPAVALLGGVALLLFGVLPRLQPLGWVAYAGSALVVYLGDPLDLPDWVRNLSPFHLVGRPPQESVDTGTLVGLSAGALLAVAIAFVGFRRRGIPQG